MSRTKVYYPKKDKKILQNSESDDAETSLEESTERSISSSEGDVSTKDEVIVLSSESDDMETSLEGSISSSKEDDLNKYEVLSKNDDSTTILKKRVKRTMSSSEENISKRKAVKLSSSSSDDILSPSRKPKSKIRVLKPKHTSYNFTKTNTKFNQKHEVPKVEEKIKKNHVINIISDILIKPGTNHLEPQHENSETLVLNKISPEKLQHQKYLATIKKLFEENPRALVCEETLTIWQILNRALFY